jgi:V8-like Glu-specific endopeptidase
MDLSKHYEEFSDALLAAFDENGLARLLRFRLNVNFSQIVGRDSLENRVFQLIEWCDQEGRVDQLFIAALEMKPGNPKLRALAGKLAAEVNTLQSDIAARVTPIANKDYENPRADELRKEFGEFQSNGALQALVVTAPHLQSGQDVVEWEKRKNESYSRICSIAGPLFGSGFLIGDDCIMTNSHVIRAGELNKYDIVFDYRKGISRDALPKYTFKSEIVRSGPREFDFVILQLDRVPDGNRGFFRAKSYLFDKIREPVTVIGHPNGDPLAIANGVVFDNNSFFGRVAYTANTAPGSSGSPVFTENWDLVALHHHGEENVNNHGIPMKSILQYLQGKPMASLLKTAP